MSLDDIHDIDDWSDIAVWALIDRIQRSSTEEHFIYRETEIDELWRNVDIAAAVAKREGSPEADRLARIRNTVMEAHDLIGVDHKPVEAVEKLKTICNDK